jgi:NADPH:quinone reductase-like Zn-dependent oxidoreductase
MRAVRLRSPGGPDELVVEDVATPRLGSGEAIVRVHAAAITRDELEWPVERLPAIPAYEMSGVVADIAPDVDATLTGQPVYALTQFDRDGAAAEFVAVPAKLLAPKPGSLDHVQAAAVPLAALSAWQGLFDHGRLQAGQRVLIHGAAGGVGQFATQLGRWAGAHVIGTTSGASTERAKRLGAHEVIEYDRFDVEGVLAPVDLVFDTAGGDVLARSPAIVKPGGRLLWSPKNLHRYPPGRRLRAATSWSSRTGTNSSRSGGSSTAATCAPRSTRSFRLPRRGPRSHAAGQGEARQGRTPCRRRLVVVPPRRRRDHKLPLGDS